MKPLVAVAAVAVSVVVSFLSGGGSASSAPPERSCTPKGSRSIAASEAVRVYRYRASVYACDLRRKRPIRLGPAGQFEDTTGTYYVDLVRVSGDLVGYAINWQSRSSGGPFRNARVRLLATSTRRFLRHAACPPATIPDAGSRAVELALVPQGWGIPPAAAWLCVRRTASGDEWAVQKFDRGGPATLEISGTPGQPLFGLAVTHPNGLVGAGPTLYWRKHGEPQPRAAEFTR